ncbi:MAG: PAS domain S-box protein [Methylacidiphilales bacterium]|nr:PAS domain S-box protein [Candidatus Methylacidiphilales bacterium]
MKTSTPLVPSSSRSAPRPKSVLRQVLLTTGILCAFLTAIGSFSFVGLRAIDQRFHQESLEITGQLSLSNDISANLRLDHASAFQHLLTPDARGMKRLEEFISTIDASTDAKIENYRIQADSPTENQIARNLRAAFEHYESIYEQVMAFSRANQKSAGTHLALTQLVPAFDQFQAVIVQLQANASAEQNDTLTQTTQLIREIKLAIDFLAAITLLVIVWTAFRLIAITNLLRQDNEKLKTEMRLRQEATRQIDRMFMLSPDLIFIFGYDGFLKQVNSAFEVILGFSTAELLSRPFLDFAHPDDVSRLITAMERCRAEGRNLGVETRCRCKDGSYKWLQFNSVASSDEMVFYGVGRDIDARKQAEAALEKLRNEHSLILNSIGEGIHWVGPDGRIKYENPASARMLGYEVHELIGLPSHATIHHTRRDGTAYPVEECPVHVSLRDGQTRTVPSDTFWRKDGTCFSVEYTCTPVHDQNGQLAGAVVIFTDITERRRLEAQLLQSQKMETVGKLAGGVAHEFNSILTAIIGQSELLLDDLPSGHPHSSSAAEIRRAAERAAGLTRQLLAYGRRQILQLRILDLNKIITDIEPMVRHLLGPHIDVRVMPTPGLNPVRVDAGQIEQVIMNMALNAGDAMPGGGMLTLETAHLLISDEKAASYRELKPGPYAVLAITDTGAGMTKAVCTRIFEPFFSTKEIGQGTGLGLATCYGIVKQSGGHISVYSEVSRGTTFKIYLPQYPAESIAVESSSPPAESPLPRGTETILLVEDDPALLGMAGQLLRRLGYDVLSASNGTEALKVAKQQEEKRIHLLFTDVIMPQTNGKDLAELIQVFQPGIKVLFTSAFTENAIVHQGALDPGVNLLHKPYTPSDLSRRIREMLGSPDKK